MSVAPSLDLVAMAGSVLQPEKVGASKEPKQDTGCGGSVDLLKF